MHIQTKAWSKTLWKTLISYWIKDVSIGSNRNGSIGISV